jgi:hypothetical protein
LNHCTSAVRQALRPTERGELFTTDSELQDERLILAGTRFSTGQTIRSKWLPVVNSFRSSLTRVRWLQQILPQAAQ